ncbi:MAG: metallophosphoesterase family protein [Verrucomicrobiae bacterium]|nr:metallophosphoesterase family protein [Verrucomicrobiae bacterium]
MRVAYVVDVHGDFAAVTRALGRIGAVDVLIIGGDITTKGSADDVARAIAGWQSSAARLFAVAGNMDSAAIDARLADLGVSLDARGVVLGGVGFFGVSAGPKSPLRTPYEITEEEMAARIETGFAAVKDCRIKVFCPHVPPANTACDRIFCGLHVGSRAVRDFIERAQPDLVLCGHIHESRGEDRLGCSRVVNPGPITQGHYAVADIGETVAVRFDA